MKKVLFVLAILTLTITSVRGQTNVYHPFPDSAVWFGEFWAPDCSGFCNCIEYSMGGDTTIGTYSYKKTGNGAFRQNIPLKLVYFYNYSDAIEYVLYDFKLAVGDSIYHNQWWGTIDSPGNLVVTSIDSINLGGTYRKVYTFTNSLSNHYHIAEGIGNLDGMPLDEFAPESSSDSLKCFQSDGQLILTVASNWCSCSYFNSVENIKSKDNNISVFPNPFSTTTLITFSQTYHSITLEVYNLQGQRVAQNHYSESSQINLSRGQLAEGLYFLKMTLDEKWVETRKIVVGE